MFDFLEIPRGKFDFKQHHFRYYESPMSPMANDTLKEHYQESNEKLFDLIGYEVPEWM
jgi:hypothetical protein